MMTSAKKTSTPSTQAQKEQKPASGMLSTHWDPFGTLRHEIDQVFSNFSNVWPGFNHNKMLADIPRPSALMKFDFSPRTDISETDKAYEITVELPGLTREDVSLSIEDEDMLVLSGEKKTEVSREEKDLHLVERSYGSFQRSFALPDDVKIDGIKAEFDKGVMMITIPKTHQTKHVQRKIDIKVH